MSYSSRKRKRITRSSKQAGRSRKRNGGCIEEYSSSSSSGTDLEELLQEAKQFIGNSESVEDDSYEEEDGYYSVEDDEKEDTEEEDTDEEEDDEEEDDEDTDEDDDVSEKEMRIEEVIERVEESENVVFDDESKNLLKLISNKLIDKFGDDDNDPLDEEIREMEREIMGDDEDNKPIKWTILKSDVISKNSKRAIIPIIDVMEDLSESSETHGTYKFFIDCVKKIPFGKYIESEITAESSISEIAAATNRFYKTINNSIYGQVIAKNKLTQIIHNGFTNPTAEPQVIGLQGPPGVGKTTLIKRGLAVSQNRPFFMYPLGGAKEGGQLEGFNMAFIGATPGWIANSLMIGQCMNPIFFFDELDKISETPSGKEIVSILMKLIDPSQNNIYSDKFLKGVELDLSKAIFIFSYNHREKVDPILLDRITEISMDSYTLKDKLIICQNYIIKEIAEKMGMKPDDVVFNNNVIEYIINNFTGKEKGVRSLQKAIKQIFMKINILRFDEIDPEVMGTSYIPNLTLPLQLTPEIVSHLLNDTKIKNNLPVPHMYL